MKQEAFASVVEPLTARREEICAVVNDSYDPAAWGDWRWQMRHRLTRLDQFERLLRLTEAERRGLTLANEKFSVAVTPYFAALIDPEDPSCPIRKQVVPVESELVVSPGDMTDPLDRTAPASSRAWCTAIPTACSSSSSTPAPPTAATARAAGWSARASSSRSAAASTPCSITCKRIARCATC
jgi:hypothetical protein